MALGHWAVEYLGEGMGQGGSGGFSPDITNPQDGDTLVYNATAGKWVNGSGGGGGAMLLHVSATPGAGGSTIYMLDKTWNEIKDALAEGTQVVLYGGTSFGSYAQFTVASVFQDELTYGIENINVTNNATYESAILGAQNKTFKASSADGYPLVVVGGK